MDVSKPRRHWLSFGIRDLLWAMVVMGLALALCRQSWDRREEKLRHQKERDLLALKVKYTKQSLDDSKAGLVAYEKQFTAMFKKLMEHYPGSPGVTIGRRPGDERYEVTIKPSREASAIRE